jgi:uncharacterized protein
MGLHSALAVQTFDSRNGVSERGVFVKKGCTICKGERVWWLDGTKEASLRTFTKREIRASSQSWGSKPNVDAAALVSDGSLCPSAATTCSDCSSEESPSSTASVSSCSESCLEMTADIADDMVAVPMLSSSNSKSSMDLGQMLAMHSYMLDDDCYAARQDESCYFGHSCTPNVAFAGDDVMIALCDIGEQEPVVYDYAFTETQDSMHAGRPCQCGTAACRGKLDFLQYKDPSFISQHYHHCTTFIQRKMRENGWVHDNVVRRRINRAGTWCHGLFAYGPIPRLTPIIIFSGKIVTGKQIESVSYREQEMCLQIDTDLWQIPNNAGHTQNGANDVEGGSFETGDFINHSCNPNCGMLESIRVITMRDIAVDEELTFDYAMTNTGQRNIAAETFECCCGDASAENALKCRGVITPLDYQKVGGLYFDFLSPFVREAYVKYKDTTTVGRICTAVVHGENVE